MSNKLIAEVCSCVWRSVLKSLSFSTLDSHAERSVLDSVQSSVWRFVNDSIKFSVKNSVDDSLFKIIMEMNKDE